MTAGIINRRPARRSSVKRATRNRPPRATPIGIDEASANGSTLTVTFDQPVMLDGVPQYLTSVANAHPVSATRPQPETVAVTYNIPVNTAASVTIPFEDPAVRNSSGGFVNAGLRVF